jgi:hypothetical protein
MQYHVMRQLKKMETFEEVVELENEINRFDDLKKLFMVDMVIVAEKNK